MDTTPEYIKMCEKATEIQSVHDITDYEHDIVCCRACGEVCHEDSGYYFCCGETDGLWLPQQDDLQAMVFSGSFSVHDLDKFYNWADERTEILHGCELESWEQLWLAFVMSEKYGKVWNGEEWVNK